MIMIKNYQSATELTAIAKHIDDFSIREAFEQNPDRNTVYSRTLGRLTYDFSRQLIEEKSFELLLDMAKEADVLKQFRDMYNGSEANNTENRKVLHTLLRAQPNDIQTNLSSLQSEVASAMAAMAELTRQVHRNKSFKHVIHLGIGGSFLGPQVIVEALKDHQVSDLSFHFIANIDAQKITRLLNDISADETLVIVASKSFTTQETLLNAEVIFDWFKASGLSSTDIAERSFAITTAIDKAEELGIQKQHILPMWDWVGGRFSLWSCIGFPIMLALGEAGFNQLLAGAREADLHVKSEPVQDNIACIMALMGIWNTNFLNSQSQAVIAYAHGMRNFPDYLQQLEMESNGKSITRTGKRFSYCTSPVIWGGEGTNGQHAYHQMILQGMIRCPVDFIAILPGQTAHLEMEQALYANCLAQCKALAVGKSAKEAEAELLAEGASPDEAEFIAEHKVIKGNVPHSLFVLEEITPHTLGCLLALYEHKTAIQGFIWEINSFDQWGVELGKQFNKPILNKLQTGKQDSSDVTIASGLSLAMKHRT